MLQKTLNALPDPTRRGILELLKNGSMPAGEIGSYFAMSGATLSHHLSVLKNAGLVSFKKKGSFIYYELNTSVMEDVLAWVSGILK